MQESFAVVTGAAGAIGQMLCSMLLKAKYHVIGLDLPGTNPPVNTSLPVDHERLVCDPAYLHEVLRRIIDMIGKGALRALINNAALQIVKGVQELNADDVQRTLQVNTIAPLLLTTGLAPFLRESHGTVINIASIHAVQTKPGFAAYAASKAALVSLTRSLAIELAPEIRVNAISPAAVDTPMLRAGFSDVRSFERLADCHPLGRIAEPAEIASIAAFLISDSASFITGANIVADGGIGCLLSDPSAQK